MMAFLHGTRVKELETGLKVFTDVAAPTVIVGTATVNMGDESCVNEPVLIQSPKDAAVYFGTTTNIKGFTINEAIYLATNVYNTFPIIAINVLDPKKHKTAGSVQDLVLIEDKVILKQTGIILNENLVIKDAATDVPLAKEKYNLKFNNEGHLEVEVTQRDSTTKISVDYEYADPKKVTENDVIGNINPETLEASGLQALKEIFPKFSMIPACVIAPDFATSKIAVALDAKSQIISNKWASFSIPELPKDIKYGEAVSYKKQKNYIDTDQLICFGVPYLDKEVFKMSTVAALHMQAVDSMNDGIPYESPSNKNIKMHGIGYYSDGNFKKLNLDETEANQLGANGICTILTRSNGTVFWGNRTSVYQPGGNTDPKDIWIPVKRMFKYIGNTLMLNNENEVDKPMTPARAKSIETNANVWLASLVAQGKLLGAKVAFLPEENSEQDMSNGRYKWHVYIGSVIPGESLEFILEYDGKYLKEFYK
ncbi:MAG: phage tail protein [Fusobacterium sp.]|nr:phage tail protein [Fusobacterium sp.]